MRRIAFLPIFCRFKPEQGGMSSEEIFCVPAIGLSIFKIIERFFDRADPCDSP